MKKELLTAEVAAILGCNQGQVSEYIRNGKLRARRIGDRYLVDAASVRAFRPATCGRPIGAKTNRAKLRAGRRKQKAK